MNHSLSARPATGTQASCLLPPASKTLVFRTAWKAVILFFGSAAAFADSDAQRAAMTFFEKEVRPVLVNRCYECHGEKKQKGGLRMDHIEHMKVGGDGGPAFIAGLPDKSPMIQAIRYADKDFQMPPKEKLPDKEIAALEKWVALGAPWPDQI